ncbi:MAG: hypothetical protein KDA81_04725 [Planctomycetaceae bacterium]|nr:hypothetical protein [Planctomycetaceae bacterium]
MNNRRLLIAAMAEQCKAHLGSSASSASGLPQPLHSKHLFWMCEQIVEHSDEWPVTKLHRWLGFVQCGILANRILDFEGIKAMFEESKNTYGTEEIDNDLADHLDPQNSFEIDVGGQG